MRVPVTKAFLELLDELPEEDRRAIREGAAEAVKTVEETVRSARLPLSVQLEILEQVDERLGRQAYLDLCRTHFARTLETPLVRPIFDAAVRLFGVGPKGVFKMFRRSWSMMSSNTGEIELVSVEPENVDIVITKLPVEERRSDLFIEGFAATFMGVLDVFNLEGNIEMVEFDEKAARARYTGHWVPAA